jgi:hypothetical protein
MRFRSANAQLRNRLADMAASENSPSDHLCQIVPVKTSFYESECGDGWMAELEKSLTSSPPLARILAYGWTRDRGVAEFRIMNCEL